MSDIKDPELATTWVEKFNQLATIVKLASALGVFTALGLAWNFLNPIGETDVSVLIVDESFIELPEASDRTQLTLAHKDESFQSALIFSAVIANTGSLTIGESGQRWQITIRHPDGLKIFQLSPVEADVPSLVDDVVVTGDDEKLLIDIGVLNPDDEFRIKLLAANHPDEYRYPLTAYSSRIAGLQQIVVARGSSIKAQHGRIHNRLFVPVYVLTVITFLVAMIRERMSKGGAFTVSSIAGIAAYTLLMPIFAAWGLSWLLAWVGYVVVSGM